MDADIISDPTTVRVELGDRSYDILIGDDLLARAGALVRPFAAQSRVFVISDETVWRLHGDRLTAGLA
ncbi:MAG: 3-dehydroquinate synthase, partial [Pseudomonadota bacterium]|nr:3-dehydroquinate synthase [Pseudomonadota bacterium]